MSDYPEVVGPERGPWILTEDWQRAVDRSAQNVDIVERRISHTHFGQERTDVIQPHVRRIECYCGWAEDLLPT